MKSFVALLLASTLLFISPAFGAEKVLRVCMMSSDLFPLWRGPGMEHNTYPGVNVELLYQITNPLGISVAWERAPFARCLLYLQSGKVDVINVASYKKEREVYGVYPILNGQVDLNRRFKYDTYYAFVKAQSKATYNGSRITNLDPLPVGVEIKAAIIPALEKMGLAILQQPEAKYSFGMLEKDRVSAVVTNQYNGLKYADMDIRRLEPALSERAYYLLFSKSYYQQNTDLVERIWFISGQLQPHFYQKVLQRYASLPGWPKTAE